MIIIRSILLAFEILICLLLIGIVLIQRSKGGGLGAEFGGGSGSQIFGSRTGNVLTKGTIILSIAFFANTMVLAMISGNRAPEQSLLEKAINQQQAQQAANPQAMSGGMPMAPQAPGGVPTLPSSSFTPEAAPEAVDSMQTETPITILPSSPVPAPAPDAAVEIPETTIDMSEQSSDLQSLKVQVPPPVIDVPQPQVVVPEPVKTETAVPTPVSQDD